MNVSKLLTCPVLALALAGAMGAPAASAADAAQPFTQPAEAASHATRASVLGAANAGSRVVTVGEHGIVLLSDDDGKSYRQADKVPLRATLNAVHFADPQQGWAVGHWGAILHTADGGRTWQTQRLDTKIDQPLFSVYFRDTMHGVAVGLWSLMLRTEDGGKTWTQVELPHPAAQKGADANLYAVFAGGPGALLVAAERGRILRSVDDGATWTYVETGYQGSFWAGTYLKSGALLVGGLKGTIYRSDDAGASWKPAASPAKSSVTAFREQDGKVFATALDGVLLTSADDGKSFVATQRADRLPLTAAAVASSGVLLQYSKAGVVAAGSRH
ncbi:YCF48-related protein [Cupriavidus sp. WKF15]|uniref:WD40/YVTN/BNR-like repeat-containing protein n=1 Tax=Cupriavidus sp. WKF15 TaxID=3032282 RepID=UPI0023E0D0DA|nr:YCF48-related protein [Cupriavidus sp. WKF15]WER48408.1 YCF48-related protein [Cupriavidus sp. WKF15]